MQVVDETVRALTEKVESLEEQCRQLKDARSFVVIQTFGDEPFELLKPILVTLEESDGEILASFYDANVGIQSDSRQQAFDDLKEAILSEFDYLDSLPDDKLGPDPKRRIAVLREFIRRRK